MSIAAASDPTAPAQPWLVLKFGGTSVSKRERWDTIGQLAEGRAAAGGARVLVVVLAPWTTTATKGEPDEKRTPWAARY